MKIADYILIAIIAVCFVAALFKIRRQGTCSCGNCRGCGSCTSCGSCGHCADGSKRKKK